MLKIRLRRVGKRNQPSYRVVVVEHTKKIQGSYLEALGTYSPRAKSFAVKEDRVLHWLGHGAQPSERMAKLLKTAGVKHKLIALPDYDRKPKRPSKKAAKVPPQQDPASAVTSEGINETAEASAKAPEAAQVTEDTGETKPEETPAEATSAAASSETPSESDGSTPEASAAETDQKSK